MNYLQKYGYQLLAKLTLAKIWLLLELFSITMTSSSRFLLPKIWTLDSLQTGLTCNKVWTVSFLTILSSSYYRTIFLPQLIVQIELYCLKQCSSSLLRSRRLNKNYLHPQYKDKQTEYKRKFCLQLVRLIFLF